MEERALLGGKYLIKLNSTVASPQEVLTQSEGQLAHGCKPLYKLC